MCTQLTAKQSVPVLSMMSSGQRRKLWELDLHWHCAIIGTCISETDLKKLALKCQAPEFQGREAAYKRHSFMVGQARYNQGVGRILHKFLERQHSRSVKRFNSAKDDASLIALWQEALDQGDIAGAFWALMTHAHASHSLCAQIYGEVHMLSHRTGANTRMESEKLNQAHKQMALLKQEIDTMRKNHRKAINKRDHVIGQVKQERDAAQIKAARCDELEARLLAEQQGQSRQELEDRCHRLTQRVIQESERADLYQRNYREEADAHKDTSRERNRIRDQLIALEAEMKVLEQQTLEMGAGACMKAQGCAGAPDLCGRCIAYIGGQTKQAAFFRNFVEQKNGQFIHHDGGLHDGQARLMSILAQADAVMFPVTCISHEATREIKRICQQQHKPFIPLRTQGLGAFTRGLEDLSDTLE